MKAKIILQGMLSLACVATLGLTVASNVHAATTGTTTVKKTKAKHQAKAVNPVITLSKTQPNMVVGERNRFRAEINAASGLTIKKYRVTSSKPKVVKVSNGLLTRALKVGRAKITVEMTLSNQQVVTKKFTIQVRPVLLVPVQTASGYRRVTSGANVWTKPYYKTQKNQIAKAAKSVRGYMVKLTQKATTIDGKIYYQVALPASGQKIGWVPANSLKAAGQYWRNTTGGKRINVKQTKNLNVEVSVAKQRVYLKSGNKVVYTMLCSTGAYATPTVTGNFKLSSGGAYFWGGSGGAKYWRAFAAGGYYFHSIPTTSPNGAYGAKYGNQLGHRASHGCIRLSVADSLWFYKNMPNGTRVYVH